MKKKEVEWNAVRSGYEYKHNSMGCVKVDRCEYQARKVQVHEANCGGLLAFS